MEQVSDHPVIRCMERTGYPTQPKVIHQCSWCDEPIYDGEDCWDLSPYGWLCNECMISRQRVAVDYDG